MKKGCSHTCYLTDNFQAKTLGKTRERMSNQQQQDMSVTLAQRILRESPVVRVAFWSFFEKYLVELKDQPWEVRRAYLEEHWGRSFAGLTEDECPFKGMVLNDES